MAERSTLIPGTASPDLSFNLVDGSSWSLHKQQPDALTMVVFYRGLHCPICKHYARTLDKLAAKFEERGVGIVTVSMDSEERARTAHKEWGLEHIDVGYGLSETQARAWGLYLSSGIKEEEPKLFCEPGLFLIRPDGTLYYAAINSMPFGRPDLKQMLDAIDYLQENDYPARGKVAP